MKIQRIVIDYDVAFPFVTCGHRKYRHLWPWDPEVKIIERAAARAGRSAQSFCKSCGRWVPFHAFR